MIYRVSIRREDDEHAGHLFFANKGEAQKYARSTAGDLSTEITSTSTPKSKSDVIALLNIWGRHPDNG